MYRRAQGAIEQSDGNRNQSDIARTIGRSLIGWSDLHCAAHALLFTTVDLCTLRPRTNGCGFNNWGAKPQSVPELKYTLIYRGKPHISQVGISPIWRFFEKSFEKEIRTAGRLSLFRLRGSRRRSGAHGNARLLTHWRAPQSLR